MLDRYIWGEPERISPEAPVLVLREDLNEVRPGGAANVASLLRHLEVDVILVGVVGEDSEGRILSRLMVERSVDASNILADLTRVTTTKQRFVGRAAQRQPHQILRVDRESRHQLASDLESRLSEVLLEELQSADAVLISDYAKGVCTELLLRRIIEGARIHKVPVLVDPCRGVDFARYAGATMVTPNRIAAEQQFGRVLRDFESIHAAVQQLRQQLDLDTAIITLDRNGIAYATSEAVGNISCRPREVCDVTGAGDMVLAMLGLCIANKVPMVESLRLANCAGGLEVEQFGVEPISKAQLIAELLHNRDSVAKMVAIAELEWQVRAWRQAGRKIVLANGCFDLLHLGHVSLLEEASHLGDILIVAINSDDGIRKLKGSSRPIIGQKDRARMLSALQCVDSIIIFDDDTPVSLLEKLQPDVLVKGAEYRQQDVIGGDVVAAYGGRVVTLPMLPGFSTTRLIARADAEPNLLSATTIT